MSGTQLKHETEVDLHEVDLAAAKSIAMALKINMLELPEVLPPMWHWLALEQRVFTTSNDGGLLPDIDNCTRMWSGGSVVNFEPIRLGIPVRRVSSISSLGEKAPGSAVCAYFAVKHDFYQSDRLIISEEQDILYCDTAQLSKSPVSTEAEMESEVVRLFRYIKSPFGMSVIHYDWRHLNGLGGTMGAVIHNSQSAKAVLREFNKLSPESVIRSVRCDGVKPLPRMDQSYLVSRVLRKNSATC